MKYQFVPRSKQVLKKTIWFGLLCGLLQSCTYVDDYLLGKDNTPIPEQMKPVDAKLNIDEQWSVSTDTLLKLKSNVKLKPAVHGNRVYVLNTDGRLLVLDAQNGHLVWDKSIGQSIVSGPTVESGYIVVGTRTADVIVLRQSDGQELWREKVSSEVLSKPAIGSNKVVVKTIDGNLYAFDLATGKKQWVINHGSPNLILKASSSPVIIDNAVFAGFSDARVVVADLESGRILWERNIAYPRGASDVERLVDIDADPIIRHGIAYLATYQGYVGALSLKNGEFLWSKPASVYSDMALDTNAVYVTDSDDIAWAFNRDNGHVKWKQLSFKARRLTAPVMMGQWLFIGDKTGYLHVLSSYNGEVIGRRALNGRLDVDPVVSGSRVYVLTANGKLSCFSLSAAPQA